MRDLLLNIKNVDIDLVVEGDGIIFAEKLAEKFDVGGLRGIKNLELLP